MVLERPPGTMWIIALSAFVSSPSSAFSVSGANESGHEKPAIAVTEPAPAAGARIRSNMKPQMIRWKRLRAGVGSCEKIVIIFDLYNVLPDEAHCLFVLHHTPDEDFSLERPPLLPMLSPESPRPDLDD
jgi:hypothetical protein